MGLATAKIAEYLGPVLRRLVLQPLDNLVVKQKERQEKDHARSRETLRVLAEGDQSANRVLELLSEHCKEIFPDESTRIEAIKTVAETSALVNKMIQQNVMNMDMG